jgi:phosphate transport system permease protein
MSNLPSPIRDVPQTGSRLHAPEPSIADVIGPSLMWALVCSLGLLLVCAGVSLLLVHSYANLSFANLMFGFGVTVLILYPVLALARVLWWSRTLLSRAFGYFALAATFFGLVMLVLFFVSITINTIRWLNYTTDTWETKNHELQKVIDDPETYVVKPALAKVDEDEKEKARLDWLKVTTALEETRDERLRDAKTDAERKTIEKEHQEQLAAEKVKFKDHEARLKKLYDRVRARKAEEVREQNVPERVKEARKGIRDDTSDLAAVAHFLTSPPSSAPEDSGILYALIGSLFMALLVLIVAVPLGVGAALYLEEYKSHGWFSRTIQVNISNLAGVPSIVYGILGAYIFVELIFKPLEFYFSGLPVPADSALHRRFVHGLGWILSLFGIKDVAARNVLGGGLTLALLTLPVVIVAAQEAIRAVPQSIRHGALALGATRWQVVAHHVLPGAAPGIMTGTILALSRAIGEAAPLVMFGALLFVDYTPGLFSRFTILPMQIFGWTDRPKDAWKFNAGAASLLLLITLLLINAVAIYFRQRAQRYMKW